MLFRDAIAPIEDYCMRNSTEESSLLKNLQSETFAKSNLPQMLSGHLEGRFLKMLVQLTGARRILEIGTFTGYSALCLAEGLPEDGTVVTCDIDEFTSKIAKKFWDMSPYGHKITMKLQDGLTTISEIHYELDLVFIDADKRNYKKYYEACLPKVRRGGLIIFDNSLWGGKVLAPSSDDIDTLAITDVNDFVFRDERVENVMLTVRDGMNLVRKL